MFPCKMARRQEELLATANCIPGNIDYSARPSSCPGNRGPVQIRDSGQKWSPRAARSMTVRTLPCRWDGPESLDSRRDAENSLLHEGPPGGEGLLALWKDVSVIALVYWPRLYVEVCSNLLKEYRARRVEVYVRAQRTTRWKNSLDFSYFYLRRSRRSRRASVLFFRC